MDDKELQKIIQGLYKTREYRPVGVAVLYKIIEDKTQFLIAKSAKSKGEWGFPQGGIYLGESLSENLSRELTEELGVDSEKDLRNFIYNIYYDELDAESTRKDKRGFTKGKAYFFTLAEYIGNGKFNLRPKEIAEVRWLTFDEAVNCFNVGRPEKADLSKMALDVAVWFLSS